MKRSIISLAMLPFLSVGMAHAAEITDEGQLIIQATVEIVPMSIIAESPPLELK